MTSTKTDRGARWQRDGRLGRPFKGRPEQGPSVDLSSTQLGSQPASNYNLAV